MRSILFPLLLIFATQLSAMDKFSYDDASLRSRSKTLSSQEFIRQSIANDDKLMLSIANSYFNAPSLTGNIAKIPNHKKITKISDGLMIDTNNENDNDFVVTMIELPVKGHYIFQYRRVFELPTGTLSYGTFRVVKKVNDKFIVASKFEDSNLVRYLGTRNNKFVSLDDKALPWYWWGANSIEKPFQVSDGEIRFSTFSFIPPNYAVMHGVRVDWRYNIRKSLLYCTNVHWDIHEQLPAPKGEEPKTVKTTVRIPR